MSRILYENTIESNCGCHWYQGTKERCCKNKCYYNDDDAKALSTTTTISEFQPDDGTIVWTGAKRGGCPIGFEELDRQSCGLLHYTTEKCQFRVECFHLNHNSEGNKDSHGCFWKQQQQKRATTHNWMLSCSPFFIEHDSVNDCEGLGDLKKCCPHIVNDSVYGQSTTSLQSRSLCTMGGPFDLEECTNGCIRSTTCGCVRDYKQEQLLALSSETAAAGAVQNGDKSNWMHEKCPNCLLSDFVLPGTHHGWIESRSGLSSTLPLFDVTQQLSPLEQLRVGVRFFDVRLALNENNAEVRVVHGGVYGRLADILSDVEPFLLEEGSTEVIVVWVRFERPSLSMSGYIPCTPHAFEIAVRHFEHIIATPESWNVALSDVAGKLIFCGDEDTAGIYILKCDGSYDGATRTDYPPDLIDKHTAWIRNVSRPTHGDSKTLVVSKAIVSIDDVWDVVDVCDEERQIHRPFYNNLKELAQESNFYVLAWLMNDGPALTTHGIGAIMVDYIPQEVIEKIIEHNSN